MCTKDQYRNFRTNYSPEFGFEETAQSYDQPCNQMTSIVTSSSVLIPNSNDIFFRDLAISHTAKMKKVVIDVEYSTAGYKEIVTYRAFGIISLWSQVGGFIGICLGYSLLQLPELTEKVIRNAMRVMECRRKVMTIA